MNLKPLVCLPPPALRSSCAHLLTRPCRPFVLRPFNVLTEPFQSNKRVLSMALSANDIDTVRSDMLDLDAVHFNNAGASPCPRLVSERVTKHMELEARVGGYEAEARCQDELEGVYSSAAELINADTPDEIALQESASMAWARVFYAVAQDLQPGDRILTCMVEYGANYVSMLQASKRTGAHIEVVPSNSWGEVDVGELDKMIRAGGVKLVSITHVPTNGGVVNPAEEVGEVCRRHGVLYLLDACQSLGQLDIDVQRVGCHMLCATGRKYLRGPRGTGFLYISKAALERVGEPPMVDHFAAPIAGSGRYQLRSDARRFEFWESSVASRLGLGVAIRYALGLGLAPIESRVRGLAGQLRMALGQMTGEGVRIMDLGDPARRCGIVSFVVDGVGAPEVKEGLRKRGIYVSTSGGGSTPMDAEARALTDVVRVSVHYFNIDAEINRFVAALGEVLAASRS